jgi:hypothetical protein
MNSEILLINNSNIDINCNFQIIKNFPIKDLELFLQKIKTGWIKAHYKNDQYTFIYSKKYPILCTFYKKFSNSNNGETIWGEIEMPNKIGIIGFAELDKDKNIQNEQVKCLKKMFTNCEFICDNDNVVYKSM